MSRHNLAAWEIALRAPDNHPFAVAVETMQQSEDPDAFIVALLHDAVEDEYATPEEIIDIFPWEIARVVGTLTRRDGEPYHEYIERIREGGELARTVKIADATVNLRRCTEGEIKNYSLAARYEDVLEKLGAATEA